VRVPVQQIISDDIEMKGIYRAKGRHRGRAKKSADYRYNVCEHVSVEIVARSCFHAKAGINTGMGDPMATPRICRYNRLSNVSQLSLRQCVIRR
jgi:hypothetical protein